jgi:hypothetical protein
VFLRSASSSAIRLRVVKIVVLSVPECPNVGRMLNLLREATVGRDDVTIESRVIDVSQPMPAGFSGDRSHLQVRVAHVQADPFDARPRRPVPCGHDRDGRNLVGGKAANKHQKTAQWKPKTTVVGMAQRGKDLQARQGHREGRPRQQGDDVDPASEDEGAARIDRLHGRTGVVQRPSRTRLHTESR